MVTARVRKAIHDARAEPTLRSSRTVDGVEVFHALSDVTQALFGETAHAVTLGRYELHEAIGRGGDGVVYRARDPELDRMVAIKVLRARVGRAETSAWSDRLRLEARAIAKLSHPNIVAVYDVGVVEDGHAALEPGVYLVMEHIAGPSLSTWMRTPRTWREVLDVMIPIGRALTAAHDAGLVHRDVKPGNVLLGSEARPRLVDFGLARALHEPGAALVGTPATMAPEQHASDRADERADQFGFCATLHAALHGVHAFDGDTLEELHEAKRVGRRTSTRSVPRWLDAAIERGLAYDPAVRWPDMRTLLQQLERGRGRLRRRLLAATGGAALVMTVGIADWRARHGDVEACVEDGDARVTTVWNAEIRERTVATLRDAGESAAGSIDDVVDRWHAIRRTVCENAAADPDLAALRLRCLEEVLVDVDALSVLLASQDRSVAASAAAEDLPTPEACADASLAARPDPELRVALNRARRLYFAGDYAEAERLARDAVARAEMLGDDRGAARGQLTLCSIESSRGRTEKAVEACRASVRHAATAGDDLQMVRAFLHLAELEPDLDEAEWNAELAAAMIPSLDARDRNATLEAFAARVRWRIATDRGRHEQGADAAREAIALITEAHGDRDSDLLQSYNALGISLSSLGDHEGAARAYARALSLTIELKGATHPSVGLLRNNVALAELASGDAETALATYRQALAEKEAHVDASSPRLVTTLQGIVRASIALRKQDAIGPAQRQYAIATASSFSGEALGESAIVLAMALVDANRCAEAVDAFATASVALDPATDPALARELVALQERCRDH